MPQMSRRALLVAGAVGLSAGLVGCSTTTIPMIPKRDPDQPQRRTTAQSEQALIALYTAAIAAVPELSDELTEIQRQHSQHLTAVSFELGDPLEPVATPAAMKDQKDALAQLRMAEKAAAKARTEASVASQDATLAQLLARIGTSESAHAAYLVRGIG